MEIMLMQASYLPNLIQNKKLTVSPEDWDCDIWGDLNDYDEGKDNLLFSLVFLWM